MVKKETIYRLVSEKVVPVLENKLAAWQFKYSKTKKVFFRKVKEFEQSVSIYSYDSGIEYDDSKDLLYLHFDIFTGVSIPAYNKWCAEKLGENVNFYSRSSRIKLYTLVEYNDFSESDFYTPSKAVAFKHYISNMLGERGGSSAPDVASLASFIDTIATVIERLDALCDITALFETREAPYSMQHINLLVYNKQTDRAKELYDQVYNMYTETLLKEPSSQAVEGFEKFIKRADRALGLKYDNPFIATIIRRDDDGGEIELAPGFTYRSMARFEGKNSKIRSGFYNEATGDIFLFSENKTIFKLDKSGNIVFEQQLLTGSAFDHKLFMSGLDLVHHSGALVLGSYILTGKNQLVTIEKMVQPPAREKERVNFTINDAICMPGEEGYAILCSFNNLHASVIFLDRDFNLLGQFCAGGSPIQLVREKKWAIVNNGRHAFFDFSGNKLFELEYGNGNRNITLSNKAGYAVSYGYATKSDLYDLETKKSKTLWCHPTYVKNYKEVLYNDTHHNFDLSIAAFSPGDGYLVGGGHHGKYVAWTLPKFERTELIPSGECLSLLKQAEVISLDGVDYLKNRGDGMSNIIFFNGGNHFLTQLGIYNFIWDKNFVNTGCLPLQRRIGGITDDHLTHLDNGVFTVYRRTR